MVLRDLYCLRCGSVAPDVALDSLDVTDVRLHCARCGKTTDHGAVCNGGLGSRYRMNDLPSSRLWYQGQTKALEVSVDGKRVAGNGDDKWEAKREQLHWKQRRKYGVNPIYIDQKGSNA